MYSIVDGQTNSGLSNIVRLYVDETLPASFVSLNLKKGSIIKVGEDHYSTPLTR